MFVLPYFLSYLTFLKGTIKTIKESYFHDISQVIGMSPNKSCVFFSSLTSQHSDFYLSYPCYFESCIVNKDQFSSSYCYAFQQACSYLIGHQMEHLFHCQKYIIGMCECEKLTGKMLRVAHPHLTPILENDMFLFSEKNC